MNQLYSDIILEHNLSLIHIFSNVLGMKRPIEKIIEKAHAVGAIAVLDGAQSAPHMKSDVQKWDCDFYAFSGHKMMGSAGLSLIHIFVKQGVVYTDFDTALKEYEDIVKSHFMKLVPPTDHKFAALHGAVWSGGSFVYVPDGIDVEIPLQSYFRLNAPGAGQFEHTLIIVGKGAKVHFIEGCSCLLYTSGAQANPCTEAEA